MAKFLTILDLAQNELQRARMHQSAGTPSSPVTGQVYYDTVLNQFGVYCGAGPGWIYLAAASGANVSQSGNSASSGILKVSAGSNTNITDYSGGTGIVKSNSSGVVSAAVSATDYAPATTGTSILKASSGGFANAVSATDYAPATSGTSILKASSGGFANAVSGTDYAPATSGSSILKGNGSGAFANAVSNTDYAPVASPTFTGTVTVPTPSVTGGGATKGYVDGVAQGLNIKNSAVAATTGAESYTITSGSVATITGTTVDGVSPAVNDYVLVKDAPNATGAGSAGSTQAGNGLYQVTNATTNLTLSRAADMSGSNVPQGAFVFVQGGTANISSGWVVSTPSTTGAFTYGTTTMKWTQFSGAGEITAGTGLAKSANTLSIENSGVLTVAHGGTGDASFTAYGPVVGGTTSTGVLQSITPGTSGLPLLSGGASAVPTFTALSVAAGGTGGTSASTAKSSLGYPTIFNTAAIGDGSSTTLTVTHNLNNAIPVVHVWDVSGANPVTVLCDITSTSVNAVTLTFGTAPASSSIKAVVTG